jgi:hypothetical protein
MRRLLVVTLFTAVAVHAQTRVGESINGFPNWQERVVLEWINRARVDPQTEMSGCAGCSEKACYSPIAPLMWSEQLNHSARFHADEMAKQRYFGHDSQCAVVGNINLFYPFACDGSASCACSGQTPTPWYARVGLFGASPAGEIIAGTGDPNYAFNLWLTEPSTGSLCAFGAQNGHRYLILTSTGGVGIGANASEAVGDFGGGPAPYKIPSAAHYPQQAA